MSSGFDEALAALVRAAVREAVAPLEAELAKMRAEHSAEGVTEHEAARRLGVSVRTVQRRVMDGSLQAVKVGGARRVLLAGVLAPDVRQ